MQLKHMKQFFVFLFCLLAMCGMGLSHLEAAGLQATYVDSDTFTLNGDLSELFDVDRQVRADCGGDGIFYSHVDTVAFNTGITTVDLNDAVLTSNLSQVWAGVSSNQALPYFDQFTAKSASDIALTVKGAPSQTARLLSIVDDSDDVLMEVTSTGHMNNVDGFRTVTPEYGAGMGIQLFGENTPEHFNQAGWYDHTGGAFEKLFIKTSGDDFTQADEDNSNWILFTTGANPGAFAEIKEFISTTQVIVGGMGWDQDINSGGSPGNFLTIKHPGFVSGDGNHHEFSVGSCGEFEVVSYDYDCEEFMFKVEHDAAAAGAGAFLVESNINGYFVPSVFAVSLVSGDLGPDNRIAGLVSAVDTSQAASADSSTRVASYVALAINGSDARKIAFSVQPGFDDALIVSGATEEDPDYGYEITSGVVADRVTGTPQDGTAFLDTSTSDLALFDSNLDYILIGSSSTFEVIDISLLTGASQSISPVFSYSTGNGTWSALTVLNDNTLGFQGSGQVSFDAPGDWATGNEAEASGDITAAYYVRIARSRAAALPTLPTESHFKTFASLETGMEIDGRGFIQPLSHPDAGAPNNSIYYSTTQAKLVYKDSGGTVNDLY
jgi:hypothetical protein